MTIFAPRASGYLSKVCLAILASLVLVSGQAWSQSTGGVSSYTLGAGDRIDIKVFGEDDLSVEALLNDAGSFSYPFLGELNAKGLTISQLESQIVTGLKGPYLIDPKVSVRILEYRRFFVRGEVKKPGGFPYEPGMTLQKAVSLAEGFTDRASRSKFYIVSDNSEDEEKRLAKLNTLIRPGDIITIEESFF
ncbi:MAG: polysaccharide biosynthesis/export family protein [Pseudomonadota bacterium]